MNESGIVFVRFVWLAIGDRGVERKVGKLRTIISSDMTIAGSRSVFAGWKDGVGYADGWKEGAVVKKEIGRDS